MEISRQSLERIQHEVITLRREIEILRAKVGVMELFATVLHTPPFYAPQTFQPDPLHEINQALSEEEIKAQVPTPPTPFNVTSHS